MDNWDLRKWSIVLENKKRWYAMMVFQLTILKVWSRQTIRWTFIWVGSSTENLCEVRCRRQKAAMASQYHQVYLQLHIWLFTSFYVRGTKTYVSLQWYIHTEVKSGQSDSLKWHVGFKHVKDCHFKTDI